MNKPVISFFAAALLLTSFLFSSCNRVLELNHKAELEPLEQGFKVSAAIGYCASLAVSAFEGNSLPANVTFEPGSSEGYSGSGLIYVNVTSANPLPYNHNTGNILIAGLWNGNGGVISILFSEINIFTSAYKFYGIYTIPVIKKEDGRIVTVFAEQDIIIGEGSDTILQLSLTGFQFDQELERANSGNSGDMFAIVKQNVWHVTIDRNSLNTITDDYYTVTGGGQIVQANSHSGGVLYHAMINTEFSHQVCPDNPIDGVAFIQNIQAGSIIDLGNIVLRFKSSCNGRADVTLATGKYVTANGKSLPLNWN